MGKKQPTGPILLRWSACVPVSEVQDPLGLGLRGSTRLASRLLFCITSITPRARYFSFIPWCIYDHREREKGSPHAWKLWDGIVIREQALTLACIAHHQGEPCSGGGLVGSREAKKWFAKQGTEANFIKMKKFSKNSALGAYFNSLVNLGLFVTDAERPDSDEEESGGDFEKIELSALGLDLAKRLDRKAGGLTTAKNMASKHRCCSVGDLAEFGRHTGLCELSHKGAADRELLRDLFFALVGTKADSHPVRRRTLLLTLELCRQFSAAGWQLTEDEFAGAVYYGEVANDESRFAVAVPPQLRDIATRWRMFYFHHYMSVALEALFSWLVSNVATRGLAGETVEGLVARFYEPSLRNNLTEILGVEVPHAFADLTPSDLFALTGVRVGQLDESLSRTLDAAVPSLSACAEDTLEHLIRSNDHLNSSAGLALPMILLSVTLGRYFRWEATNYGRWLASTATDPYLDLVPPLVSTGLARRFGSWWTSRFSDLTAFVLSRYVVQQHQSMSYEKTTAGERCLLQVDGPKLVSGGGFDKIGLGNPRLRSALQILTDLGLMSGGDDGVGRLTSEGESFLTQELAKEVAHEVS